MHRSTPWVMTVKAGNTVYTSDAVPDRLATGGERGRPSGPRYRQRATGWGNESRDASNVAKPRLNQGAFLA
ncbi:hypothetical protein [Pseudarthrobacter siccitolerans]